MKNLLFELAFRFSAPTPVFWKKMQKLFLGIAGLGTSIIGVNAVVPTPFPPGLNNISSYLLLIGTIGAFLAQFAFSFGEKELVVNGMEEADENKLDLNIEKHEG